MTSIDSREKGINQIMSNRPISEQNPREIKHLLNRHVNLSSTDHSVLQVVTKMYNVDERIKENVLFQREINKINWKYFQGLNRLDRSIAKSQEYVNFYL